MGLVADLMRWGTSVLTVVEFLLVNAR